MASVTIRNPLVISLIGEAAINLTDGNKTEVIALAMRRLLNHRSGSLFGAHPGSVQIKEVVDLVAPIFDVVMDAAN